MKIDLFSLTYREIRFPNQYIVLKRLEEKNHRINENRFNVDQNFRSLKLQYQTLRFANRKITFK